MRNTFMLSINPPYTDMIFRGEKKYEFRNAIMKNMKPGDRIYIYETKNKGGCGKVIGYAVIEKIIGPVIKGADENYIYYDEKKLEEVREDIWNDAWRIYAPEITDKMELALSREFASQKLDYEIEMGFFGKWNYAVRIGEPHKYKMPKELSEFSGKNGSIVHPPQNMMSVVLPKD